MLFKSPPQFIDLATRVEPNPESCRVGCDNVENDGFTKVPTNRRECENRQERKFVNVLIGVGILGGII